MKRRGRKGLSDEDRALWNKTIQSVTPLSPTPKTTLSMAKPEKGSSNPKPVKAKTDGFQPPKFEVGSRAQTRAMTHSPVTASPKMDSRAFKKLRQGKSRPEGTLDLHGMTVAMAHPALIAFIMRAHSEEKRLVLIITGKGRGGEDHAPLPTRRGILRQQLPHWLSTPPLASLILQVTPAHDRHGGSGAFYVYLRRRR